MIRWRSDDGIRIETTTPTIPQMHYNSMMRPRDDKRARRNAPPSPNMIDTERYERLLEIMQEIDEASHLGCVIVEGKRDLDALRILGVEGEIITFNRGVSVHEFCEQVLAQYSSTVILMDWDGTGQKLQDRLCKEMPGAWEPYSHLRRVLKMLCQKEIRDIEGIPGLVRRLRENAITRAEG